MPIDWSYLSDSQPDASEDFGAESTQMSSSMQDMGFQLPKKRPPLNIAPVPENTPEQLRSQMAQAQGAAVEMQRQLTENPDPERGFIADWIEEYKRSDHRSKFNEAQTAIAENVSDPELRRQLQTQILDWSGQYEKLADKDPVEANNFFKQAILATANKDVVTAIGAEVGKSVLLQAGLWASGVAEASGGIASGAQLYKSGKSIKAVWDAYRAGKALSTGGRIVDATAMGTVATAKGASALGTAYINYNIWGRSIKGEVQTRLLQQNPGIDHDLLDHASTVAGLLGAGIFSIGVPKSMKQFLMPAAQEALEAGTAKGISAALKEAFLVGPAKMVTAMTGSEVANTWQSNQATKQQMMRDIENGTISGIDEAMKMDKYTRLEGWDLVAHAWDTARDSVPAALGFGVIGGAARMAGEARARMGKLAREEIASKAANKLETDQSVVDVKAMADKLDAANASIRKSFPLEERQIASMSREQFEETKKSINEEYKAQTGLTEDLITDKASLAEFHGTDLGRAQNALDVFNIRKSEEARKKMQQYVNETIDTGLDVKKNKKFRSALQNELREMAKNLGVPVDEAKLDNFIDTTVEKKEATKVRKDLGVYAPPEKGTTKQIAEYNKTILDLYNRERETLGMAEVSDNSEAAVAAYAKVLAGKAEMPEIKSATAADRKKEKEALIRLKDEKAKKESELKDKSKVAEKLATDIEKQKIKNIKQHAAAQAKKAAEVKKQAIRDEAKRKKDAAAQYAEENRAEELAAAQAKREASGKTKKDDAKTSKPSGPKKVVKFEVVGPKEKALEFGTDTHAGTPLFIRRENGEERAVIITGEVSASGKPKFVNAIFDGDNWVPKPHAEEYTIETRVLRRSARTFAAEQAKNLPRRSVNDQKTNRGDVYASANLSQDNSGRSDAGVVVQPEEVAPPQLQLNDAQYIKELEKRVDAVYKKAQKYKPSGDITDATAVLDLVEDPRTGEKITVDQAADRIIALTPKKAKLTPAQIEESKLITAVAGITKSAKEADGLIERIKELEAAGEIKRDAVLNGIQTEPETFKRDVVVDSERLRNEKLGIKPPTPEEIAAKEAERQALIAKLAASQAEQDAAYAKAKPKPEVVAAPKVEGEKSAEVSEIEARLSEADAKVEAARARKDVGGMRAATTIRQRIEAELDAQLKKEKEAAGSSNVSQYDIEAIDKKIAGIHADVRKIELDNPVDVNQHQLVKEALSRKADVDLAFPAKVMRELKDSVVAREVVFTQLSADEKIKLEADKKRLHQMIATRSGSADMVKQAQFVAQKKLEGSMADLAELQRKKNELVQRREEIRKKLDKAQEAGNPYGRPVGDKAVVAHDGKTISVPYGKQVEYGTARDLLAKIAADTKQPYMISRLASLLGRLPGTDKIGVIYTNDARKPSGQFLNKLDKIEVNTHFGADANEIVLHEAVHAATFRAILQGISNFESLMPEQKDGFNQLQSLWNKHSEGLAKHLLSLGNENGAKQIRGSSWEFISYALTHKDAYDYLSKMKEPSTLVGRITTAFKAMLEKISKLIGFGKSSALVDTMDAIAKRNTATYGALESLVKIGSTKSEFSYAKMLEIDNPRMSAKDFLIDKIAKNVSRVLTSIGRAEFSIENAKRELRNNGFNENKVGIKAKDVDAAAIELKKRVDMSILNPRLDLNDSSKRLGEREAAIADDKKYSRLKLIDIAKDMMRQGIPIDIRGAGTRRELIDRIYGTENAAPDWAVHRDAQEIRHDKVGSYQDTNTFGRITRAIIQAHSNAVTAFYRLGGVLGERFATGLVKAGQKSGDVRTAAQARVDKIVEYRKTADKDNVNIVVNGYTNTLTHGERMAITIQSRNAKDVEILKRGGYVTEEGKKISFGETKEQQDANFEKFKNDVTYKVGSDAYQIASEMIKIADEFGEMIGPIAREYFGKDFEQIENYWRRFVYHTPEAKAGEGKYYDRFGNWGPTKERQQHSKGLMLKDAYQVLDRMVRESSHFIGHAGFVKEWRSFLSNGSIQAEIFNKMGGEVEGRKYWESLSNYINHIEGKSSGEGLTMVNRLLRFQDVARFSNPFTALKQFASTANIPILFTFRDWVSSLKALDDKRFNEIINDVGGGYIKDRIHTRASTPELLDNAAAHNATLMLKENSLMDKMRQLSTRPISLADFYTIKQTVTAAYHYVSRTMPELAGSRKNEQINFEASRALFSLQPVGEAGWKAEIANSGLWGRLWTRYQHVPLALFNQTMRSKMNLDRNPNSRKAWNDFMKTMLFGTLASGSVLAGVDAIKSGYYQWLSSEYGNPQKDEDIDKSIQRLKNSAILSSFEQMPGARNFTPIIKGFVEAWQDESPMALFTAEKRVGQDPATGSQLQNLTRTLEGIIMLKKGMDTSKIRTGKEYKAHMESRSKQINRLTQSALDLISESMGIPLGSISRLTGASNLLH